MNDNNNIELPKKLNPEAPELAANPPVELPTERVEVNTEYNNTNIFDQPSTTNEITTQEPNLNVNIFDIHKNETEAAVNLPNEISNIESIDNTDLEINPFDSLTSLEIAPENNPINHDLLNSNLLDMSTPEASVEPLIFEPVINNIPEYQNTKIEEPIVEPVVNPEPMVYQDPIVTDNVVNNIIEPISPTINTEVVPEPSTQEPLKKKVLVEAPVEKKKEKGNMFVGFIAVLLILAIILATLFYFINMDYIKIPDNIRSKIPFISEKMSTPNKITLPPEEDITENKNEYEQVNFPGDYEEAELTICPDIPSKLTLTEDFMFTYHKLNYNAETNECLVDELIGNYTAEKGILSMTTNNNDVITANYRHTGVTTEISIDTEGPTVILYNINE